MSKIEWTQKTWNPIVGCSITSPGCINCYAMLMASRIEAMNAEIRPGHRAASQYDGTTRKVNGKAVWTGELREAPEATLLAPLKRKAPTTWFVNSMSDLFHEDTPDDWIDKVVAVMALTPQHTYQVLTKRSKRMREYMTAARAHPVGMAALDIVLHDHARNPASTLGSGIVLQGDIAHLKVWPLPNVWLGVSTERQQEADERIPDLLATPAALRFISAEPLLGPIDLTKLKRPPRHGFGAGTIDAMRGWTHAVGHGYREFDADAKLDWVIVGGESGPDARPMHPDWLRSLRGQCNQADVRFFFKQWGEYREFFTGSPAVEEVDADSEYADSILPLARSPSWLSHDGRHFHSRASLPEGLPCRLLERVGKAAAGRVLDGLIHDEYPEAAR